MSCFKRSRKEEATAAHDDIHEERMDRFIEKCLLEYTANPFRAAARIGAEELAQELLNSGDKELDPKDVLRDVTSIETMLNNFKPSKDPLENFTRALVKNNPAMALRYFPDALMSMRDQQKAYNERIGDPSIVRPITWYRDVYLREKRVFPPDDGKLWDILRFLMDQTFDEIVSRNMSYWPRYMDREERAFHTEFLLGRK